jgi:hypothetical protein
MVKGRRQRRAPGQEIVTLVMQALASTVLLKPLTDINAQPKAFPRALYELFRDPPHDFNLDLYLYHLALQRGYDVKTIPVVFGERPFGVSKWAMNLRSRWKHIKATIRYIFRLRMRS